MRPTRAPWEGVGTGFFFASTTLNLIRAQERINSCKRCAFLRLVQLLHAHFHRGLLHINALVILTGRAANAVAATVRLPQTLQRKSRRSSRHADPEQSTC